jgi:hypothetical protein
VGYDILGALLVEFCSFSQLMLMVAKNIVLRNPQAAAAITAATWKFVVQMAKARVARRKGGPSP